MKFVCPSCNSKSYGSSDRRTFRRVGRYWRKSDGRWIQRFQCLNCQKGFSSATGHPCYRQNKRHKNQGVRRLLAAGVSQRESARILGLNRKTIVRKLLFWAEIAELELQKLNQCSAPFVQVEFDDLETFEHTKCKPLSVTLMVEFKTRRIIDFEVARMPAKGLLARIARKKYGPRVDDRPRARRALFERVQKCVDPKALIRSDSNPHYFLDVKHFFPQADYQTIKGKRGAVTGQGELKKTGYDPIFSLNHTFAMLRANINRLIRKTWCTTKRPDRLKAHIYLYSLGHNRRVLNI